LIFAGWLVGVSQRSSLIVDVLRDRNALYRAAADGGIENGYTLKVSNKQGEMQVLYLRLEDAGAIVLPGSPLRFEAAADQTINLPITLTAPAGSVRGRQSLRFVVESEGEKPLRVEHEAAFFGPVQ
jgi:polyferredoxin